MRLIIQIDVYNRIKKTKVKTKAMKVGKIEPLLWSDDGKSKSETRFEKKIGKKMKRDTVEISAEAREKYNRYINSCSD